MTGRIAPKLSSFGVLCFDVSDRVVQSFGLLSSDDGQDSFARLREEIWRRVPMSVVVVQVFAARDVCCAEFRRAKWKLSQPVLD